MANMEKETLGRVLSAGIADSTLWASDTLRSEQLRNMAYYLGLPMGNEVDGRSQVVSWDVFEVVESALPNLLEPFFSGDDIGEYAPTSPENEAFASQATDYANYIIKDENPGFITFSTWLKDAMLSKVGIVRAEWVKSEPKRVTLEGLDEAQLVRLVTTRGVEIVEHTARPVEGLPPEMGAVLHDVTYLQSTPGRVEIENVKPEAFIVSRGASRVDRAKVVGEIVTYTRSDLVEMGFRNAMEVQSYPFAEALVRTDLDATRQQEPVEPLREDNTDPALEEVRLFRGYLRTDFDGDGIAEWRYILAGSGNDGILENEEAEGPDYCVISPILIPHRLIGMGYADPAAEIQDIKTALTRNYIDGQYLATRPRTYVNMTAKVNMDDVLNARIGGVIRGQGPAGDAITPIATTFDAAGALQGIQFMDTVREGRTGVTRYNQGLDADSLNKTATGVTKIMGAADRRQLMTLRIMAETGVKDLFRLVLRLVCAHQDSEKVVKLRNEWVAFDPRQWPPDMCSRIETGIGSGDKTETLMLLQQFGQYMQWAEADGIVTPQNKYEFGLMLAKNARIQGADQKLLTNPQNKPRQSSPPPQVMVAQMKMQAEQAQATQDVQKWQAEKQFEAAEAEKNRAFELAKQEQDLAARHREKLLELASGILAAQVQAAAGVHDPRNLINGTVLDQTAQSVPLSSMDINGVAAAINDLANGLGGAPL